MAEIVAFKPRPRRDAETCAEIYARLNYEMSNVVFSPDFCREAREEYARRRGSEDDGPELRAS